MVIYSHSKLCTFEQCPLKYKFRYIDKIKPEIEKTIESHLGSSVHDTLEWIYNSVKENPENIPSLDDIINHYIEIWQREMSEDTLIVKKQFTEKDYLNKGIQFLADYFQKYYPFKDGTIECEKEIIIELDENIKIRDLLTGSFIILKKEIMRFMITKQQILSPHRKKWMKTGNWLSTQLQ